MTVAAYRGPTLDRSTVWTGPKYGSPITVSSALFPRGPLDQGVRDQAVEDLTLSDGATSS